MMNTTTSDIWNVVLIRDLIKEFNPSLWEKIKHLPFGDARYILEDEYNIITASTYKKVIETIKAKHGVGP